MNLGEALRSRVSPPERPCRMCERCASGMHPWPKNRKYCGPCRIVVRRESGLRRTGQYAKRNAELLRSKRRTARAANPEAARERVRKWRANHPRQRLVRVCACGSTIERLRSLRCEPCADEFHRAWNRAWAKRKRMADPERDRIRQRERYARLAEQKREYARKWKASHLESVANSHRAWERAHPEIVAAAKRRRRAMKRGAAGSFSAAEFKAVCERYGWTCAYCGTALTRQTVTADHAVPLSRGGSGWIDNIVPACRRCNSRKGTKPASEFVALLNAA
jgi:5-methylcytosine-specific restriction endonuclease McrA